MSQLLKTRVREQISKNRASSYRRGRYFIRIPGARTTFCPAPCRIPDRYILRHRPTIPTW